MRGDGWGYGPRNKSAYNIVSRRGNTGAIHRPDSRDPYFPITTEGRSGIGPHKKFVAGSLQKSALDAVRFCESRGYPIRNGETLLVTRVEPNGEQAGSQTYLISIPEQPSTTATVI